MIRRLIVPLLLIVCVFAGCRRSSTPPPTAPPLAAASPTTQLNHPGGGETPPPQIRYFKGSIGSSLDLQMKLVRAGDQLTGSYYYQRVGTKINLKGGVDKDGNLTLDEFDPSGKQTGVFKGLWTVDSQDGLVTLAGNWSKPPTDKAADKKTAFSVHEQPIALSGDVEIVSKQIKESNKKLMYEITAQYPQLSGGNNPNFEKFNQAVRSYAMKQVADFKKEMAPEEGEEPPPEGSMGSDLTIGYTVALAQDDLISISLDMGSYYQGAAHPNSNTHVVNYDLKNGKQLKLSDLFKPGAKFLQTLSAYCIADLKKQSKEKGDALTDTDIQNGAGPTANNYANWTITKKGLRIDFDSYQVGPYAAGPQFVVVPYANLKEIVNPDGPIGQFAK